MTLRDIRSCGKWSAMNSRLESFSQEVVTTIRRRTCIAESLWHGSGFPVQSNRMGAADRDRRADETGSQSKRIALMRAESGRSKPV